METNTPFALRLWFSLAVMIRELPSSRLMVRIRARKRLKILDSSEVLKFCNFKLTRRSCLYLIGRLHQVEYAMEAITQAGTCVGVLTPEGVILGAQKRVVSKLLETKGQTYVYHLISFLCILSYL